MLVVGALQENCYVCSIGNNAFIVDPGDEADKIIDACMGKNVVEIIVTHHHFDHVGALDEIKKYFKIQENVKSDIFDYEIIETPGHTSDSRSDIDMIKSLEKISKYPDDIIIYPGHGPKSTLGREKNNFKYYY